MAVYGFEAALSIARLNNSLPVRQVPYLYGLRSILHVLFALIAGLELSGIRNPYHTMNKN
jgi:hypothetical protein